MKKLFTSLLLLGAVTATQAQVTVTAYDADNSSVTINFTYDGARPTPKKVEDAIKAAFQGPQSTYNVPGAQRKQIKTIILTGDWKNVDIAPENNGGNKSIAKIIEEFSDDQHLSTLDLSACQGFESKYVSVRDYYGEGSPKAGQTYANRTLAEGNNEGYTVDGYADGYTSDRLETEFTYLPAVFPITSNQGDEMGSTTVPRVSTVTVTENCSSEVTKSVSYYLYSPDSPITFETDAEGNVVNGSWKPNPLPQGFASVVKGNDGHYYVVRQPDGYQEQLGEIISYTFTLPNGKVQTVPQDQVSNIRTGEDNKLYFDYTLYEYDDADGRVATTSTTTPHQLQSDGNGGYVYSRNETVYKFAIHKDSRIDCIIFPVSDNFTFIPNNLLKENTIIKKAVLSNKIVAIGNRAFELAVNFEEINFPSSIQEIGHSAFHYSNLKCEANLAACTNLSRIRFETFQDNHNLTVVTFPAKIREIQKEAFEKCALVDVDLRNCHELRRLAGKAFNNMQNAEGKYSLINVYLCSHEKIIRGTSSMNAGDSNGAFALCNNIKRVEVFGCENTCVTECVCENRAFEWDITHNQTGAPEDIYEKVALLVYPKDLPACEGSGYTSSYDFFVGDYKAGTLMMQETLLGYHRQIPNKGYGEGKFYWYEEDQNGTMTLKDEVRPVSADDRYIGNGWLEFVLTGATQYVPKGEFLRTYSRTAGDGPLKLPKEVTAYRAVDYKTDQFAYVLDRQGKYFYDATFVSENEDDKYKLIDGIDGTEPDDVISAAELALIGNSKRYSHLTIGGKLFLRPLVAKVAEYPGITGGYTGDNIALFDSEEVYSQLTAVPGGISYVPEGTGVVLYSEIVAQDAVFMLGGDFGTGTVYKKFPHTGDRYEQNRLNSSNTNNDINMLQGSYGTGWPVAPVFPWVYSDEDACKGGHYSKTEPKAYRNFACVMTHEGETLEGGLTVRNSYGWKRLQPSKLKVNRAFAQIPVSRFDNFNEDADLEQFPGFTIEDTTADVPEVDNEGTETSGNANLMLISIFEGQSEDGAVVDGIEEVKTVDNVVAKKENNAWYTLQGVRVSNLTKGIYIHNGKKVVIK